MNSTKKSRRQRIRYRIRSKISGTALKPRLSVFRSNQYVYCQLIDDLTGTTLASASSKEVTAGGTKVEQASAVGKMIAERAKAKDITTAVFDRGGFLYHGRVKAIAEGAREGGLAL